MTLIESLIFLLELLQARPLASALPLTFLSFKLPQNHLPDFKHTVAFLAHSSKVLPQSSQSQNSQVCHSETWWSWSQFQRPWKSAACWLTPQGLLSLFSSRTQNHQPRDDITQNWLGPPTLVTSLEQALQPCVQSSLGRHLFKWSSLLPSDFSLFQVWNKIIRHN